MPVRCESCSKLGSPVGVEVQPGEYPRVVTWPVYLEHKLRELSGTPDPVSITEIRKADRPG